MNELIKIGRVLKTIGFDGKILINFDYKIIGSIKAIFIDLGDNKTPYIIEEITENIDTYIIQLSSIKSKEEAVKLNSKDLFVPLSIFESEFEEDEVTDYIGYKVYDDNVYIGKISLILYNTQHYILEIDNEKYKQNLIPMVEEYIVEINEKEEIIKMRLPMGLFE